MQSWATPRASGHRQWLALSGLVTTVHVVSRRLDATWRSSGGKAVRRRVNMGNTYELKLSRWRNMATLTVCSHPSKPFHGSEFCGTLILGMSWAFLFEGKGYEMGHLWGKQWRVFLSIAVKLFTGHLSPDPEFTADSIWLSVWPWALANKMCLIFVVYTLFLQLNAF